MNSASPRYLSSTSPILGASGGIPSRDFNNPHWDRQRARYARAVLKKYRFNNSARVTRALSVSGRVIKVWSSGVRSFPWNLVYRAGVDIPKHTSACEDTYHSTSRGEITTTREVFRCPLPEQMILERYPKHILLVANQATGRVIKIWSSGDTSFP
jgi:hypothetical protein